MNDDLILIELKQINALLAQLVALQTPAVPSYNPYHPLGGYPPVWVGDGTNSGMKPTTPY
jgi:hypothetical protein